MGEKNYRLIYEAIQYQDAIFDAERQIAVGKSNLEFAKKKFRVFLAQAVGHLEEELEFSNECCIANGIMHHVFLMEGVKHSGKNVCVFCGCDDWTE